MVDSKTILTMQFFTKTYVKDLPWLRLAMISVLKNCHDPIQWTVCIEEQHLKELADLFDSVVSKARTPPQLTMVSRESLAPDSSKMEGYLAQQWIKLNIHRIFDGGKVWMWDSDVIALKNFAERDFIALSGRPVYFFTPYNSILDGGDRAVFESRIATQKQIFGLRDISFEWMRCMPICFFPEILRCGVPRYEWTSMKTRCDSGDRSVSEFNLYGQFACMFFPDSYQWFNTERLPTWQGAWDNPAKITCQSWSWGGIPNSLKDFVEKM